MFASGDKGLISALQIEKGWGARKNYERISWKEMKGKFSE